MLAYLRKPHPDLASVILRLGLGYLFLAHGYIKIVQDFPLSRGITHSMQNAIGWAEMSFGALLILGLLSRLAALGVIVEMIGAIVMVTGKRDYISVELGPEGDRFLAAGFEYNILIIVACLVLLVLGSGWFSLDHLIFCRKKGETTAAGAPLPRSENAIAPTFKVGER